MILLELPFLLRSKTSLFSKTRIAPIAPLQSKLRHKGENRAILTRYAPHPAESRHIP
jgi:hypothetical protein